MNKEVFLAVDPGKDKCGLVIIDISNKVYFLNTISTELFVEEITNLYKKFHYQYILLGNGTYSKSFVKQIKKLDFLHAMQLELVDEYNTTVLAKQLYWRENPPKGWRKLIPRALLNIDVPIDGYAALVIANRWLLNRKQSLI